ncbi:two component transcriptional regulator, LytTR family [Fibrisoma limi BUZ 3]|uniref:Two component transcriptional regulator, LytTR family n=1 Tax=Fibrisoma limi BUZ 3 TaxID=1185876 RepID=I2GC38_9BACT|nr:LytTR family DNA-binding domain-containing protein [Fibrisoma limi]CCH51462.1 two component transcriptional regulator, LytTR family [Fibrisoma limi BUZ 3]
MLRTLLVDDEPLALTILSDYVGKVPFLQLVGATTSPIAALQRVQAGEVDVVLLDIQMPELTGIQFLKIVGNRCRIILTTAYSEYALDGYEHDVVDYLLKPISFERFYRAVQKLLPSPGAVSAPEPRQPTDAATAVADTATSDFIFVKTEYRLQRVDLADVLYAEGLKDYVSLYTGQPANPTRLLTLQTMKHLEEKLPVSRFVRVHKSYIVALNRIESIERNRIYIGKAVIPIGDTYRDEFFRRVEG